MNSPFFGWVTTILCSAKTLPPPTGMSLVRVSSCAMALGAADVAAAAEETGAEAAGDRSVEPVPAEFESLQPATSAAAPVARTVRRDDPVDPVDP
ncbi:hypothetical protein GCM10023336_66850 [Streptomyces similanensis]|uniref:Secreted protein n=1 Tax=Streptomyces similanensis TaxID=1274988 RepID=A0ABP9LE26_9ACTN